MRRAHSGTLISSGLQNDDSENVKPACITNLDTQVLIELTTLETKAAGGTAGRCLGVLEQLGITVHLATQASQGQVCCFCDAIE